MWALGAPCGSWRLEGRYFSVFGPRQDPASQYLAVIPKFITAMLKDETPVIYGDGLPSPGFTCAANGQANLRDDLIFPVTLGLTKGWYRDYEFVLA